MARATVNLSQDQDKDALDEGNEELALNHGFHAQLSVMSTPRYCLHLVSHFRRRGLRTIVELLCFPLQGHPRGICFNTAMASTGTVRPIQRHHEVAELCRTERAAVDQLVLVDDSTTNPCSERQVTVWHYLKQESV